MASGTISTGPQAESAPTQGRYEDFIQKRLEQTRHQVRLVDVGSGMMLLAAVSLIFFLAVAVLDQWVFNHGLNFIARLGLFLLWVVGAGTFMWRFLLPPLANRINPVFAAQAIEQSRPTLKNSLINFLLLRRHQQDVAPVVYRAMEHRAAADLLKVRVEHAVDHSRMLHLAYLLGGVVVIFAIYLALSPKSPFVSAARVIWPWSSIDAPTRVHIEDVRPGDGVVFHDDRQEITAQVTGLRDGEEVALLVSTADGQIVDDRIIMTAVDDAHNYRCDLPEGGGGFQQDTFYRITAGDATTQQYKLEVQIAPTIAVDRIEYHFPAYTELKDRTVANQGDIKALEGTQVTIHATANMDIKDARIDLNCEGLQTISMTTTGARASGQFTLPLYADDVAKSQYESYQIFFTGANGHNVRRPIRYHIEVDRDLKPEIAIVEPHQEEVEIAEDGQRPIRLHAFDPDYALRHVTLQGERQPQAGGESEKLGLPVLLDRIKPDKAWPKAFDAEYTFRPADWKLKAGDEVHYWATADDNKEPRANHSETPHRTIRIVAAGQAAQQDSQDQSNGGAGQPQLNQNKPGKGGSGGDKSQKGQGDSSNKDDPDAKQGEPSSGGKPGGKGQDTKGSDSKHGDNKPQGQSDKSGGPGQEKAFSDPANTQKNGEKSSEPSSSEAGDQPNEKIAPDDATRQADLVKEILKHKEKQDNAQQNAPKNQPDQSGSDQKQNQPQDSGQQDNKQQGSPQQDNQQQKDGQGGKQQQGNSGDKKDQGGTSGEKQNQGGSPQSGQDNQGQRPQGGQQGAGGQGDQKQSPQQQGNSSGSPNGGSQSQGKKDAGSQSSNNQSPSPNAGGKDEPSKSSGGPKEGSKNAGGQPKPESKQSGGGNDQQGQSAGGSKTDKPQPGGQQSKDQSANGGTPQNSEKKQSGSQGAGDEKQTAMNNAKPEQQNKASGSDHSGTQDGSGGDKPGKKPSDESSNSQGGGQGSKAKPQAQEKQDGGGQSSGGEKPKSGQGEQPGSSSGGSKSSGKAGENGGSAEGDQPGQKDPGSSGSQTDQNSSKAPSPQTESAPGEKKTSDSNNRGQNPENGQPPGNSERTSDSKGESSGDRKGGGAGGGGGDQHSNKNGKGTAGSQMPADEGGKVSDEHGPGGDGKKAGEATRTIDKTDSPAKRSGQGNGDKHDSENDQTAKDPKGDNSKNTAESESKSDGGQSGAQSSQKGGSQGSALPGGGSQAGNATSPAAKTPPRETGPDPANLEFSKKQVDLALEHLKDQMAKQKPELLDRLGWTKEEGQKFLENLQKLKDSAQQPGSDGEAGKKAYNEFLKNLDLHPHGTQIRGQMKADDLQNVRDSGQMEPPSDWADLYHAYSHGTAGQK